VSNPAYRQRKNYDEAIRDYNNGTRIKELADRYCMSRVGMYLLLRARGVTIRDTRKKLNVEDAISMYSSGATMKAIANKYGTSVSAVSLAFKQHKIPTRRAKIEIPESVDAFEAAKEDLVKEFGENVFICGDFSLTDEEIAEEILNLV
jgi:uncharacterized protein YjcR